MKSIAKFLAAAASLSVAVISPAYAAINIVPEPGSIALVVLGVAGVAFFSRRK